MKNTLTLKSAVLMPVGPAVDLPTRYGTADTEVPELVEGGGQEHPLPRIAKGKISPVSTHATGR
jgi:hypothetical protein